MKTHVVLCSCGCERECLRLELPDGSLLHEAVRMMRPVVSGHKVPGPIILHEDHIAMRRRADVFKNTMETVRHTMNLVRKRVMHK
jgi:hypothetical protein